jgi:hypothetical protein
MYHPLPCPLPITLADLPVFIHIIMVCLSCDIVILTREISRLVVDKLFA